MSAQISPDLQSPLSEPDLLNIFFAEEDRETIRLAVSLRQKSRALRAACGINVEDVNSLIESIVSGKDAGLVLRRRTALQSCSSSHRTSQPGRRNDQGVTRYRAKRRAHSTVAACRHQIVEGPAQISREDTRRRIGVELNVRGRDIKSFVDEAQRKLAANVQLPSGYYLTWGGQFENLQRATERLMIVVPLALFLIFVLLFTTFNSVKQAVLIYTSIPLAAVVVKRVNTLMERRTR